MEAAADNSTVVLNFSQGFCGVFIKAGAGLSSFGSLIIILLNIVRGNKGESSICQLRHEIAFSPSISPGLQEDEYQRNAYSNNLSNIINTSSDFTTL